MKTIDALELGGTLFVPALHKHLEAIARGEKFPTLRSVVIDLEDGLNEESLDKGMYRIEALLKRLQPAKLLRFIRPRNVEVLQELLTFGDIDQIDGFVLPKFTLDNADSYFQTLFPLSSSPFASHVMPSIEGKELFDTDALKEMRSMFLPYREQIPLIRFGAEDLLRQLGIRRDCSVSLYDMAASSQVIANMLVTFKPYGFEIAAPVFGCYRDHEAFKGEVLRDMQEGLISKTIIHPDQIEPINRLYRVTKSEHESAQKILDSKESVFALDGEMAEKPTQLPWAEKILQRAKLYGLR